MRPPPTPTASLDPGDAYLWECARRWRDPVTLPDTANLDWSRVVAVALRNRMQVLLHGVVQATHVLDRLPPAARDALESGVLTYEANAREMTRVLGRYLPDAAARDIPSVVFKGLHLCEKVYAHPTIRPGMDIDLIVRRRQVAQSVAVLEQHGLGRYWPPLLADVYYDRHHLHRQRCTPDHAVWVDVHWALDHPFTRLTIDYDALIDRTRPGTLAGYPVRELSPTDELLCLAVHLVKHAVYLPSVRGRIDLDRIILADGMLMYFVDIAEVVKRRGSEIAWSPTVGRARQWGAAEMLGAALDVCHRHLSTPVPDEILGALGTGAAGRVTRWFMNRLADGQVGQHLGRKPHPVWSFLIGYNDTLVLRPIRVLDFSSYVLPGRDYLRRRYGGASSARAVAHAARALGQAARFCLDTIYYTLKRRMRPNPVSPLPR